jgi:hypothetical protein
VPDHADATVATHEKGPLGKTRRQRALEDGQQFRAQSIISSTVSN